jgi:hypothetical protein
MDVNKAVEIFKGHGFESPAQVLAQYRMHYRGEEVRVELRDYGMDAGPARYEAEAWQPSVPEDERDMNTKGLSLGNASDSIDGALAGPHWWIFTQDDDAS